jgi:DNA (cytosine-5)-methyltransferase 1
MEKKPVLIDLFAGCGGLSLGMEQAGFEPIFVNEINESALETYITNRNIRYPLLGQKYKSNDVKELLQDPSYIPDLLKSIKRDFKIDDIDLIAGGPPCQGFSGIGHRRSYGVDKTDLPSNHLYKDMAQIISKIRPKIFLFENVRGLLNARWTKTGSKGEIWNDVQTTFSNIDGYAINSKLVFAKDYGVPQNRPRILLIGIRGDYLDNVPNENESVANGFIPKPEGLCPSLIELLGDLIDPNYTNGGETKNYPSDITNEFQESLRFDPYQQKIMLRGDYVSDHSYSKHSDLVLSKYRYMLANNGKILEEHKTHKFSQRLLRAEWGEDGPNITATSAPDDYVHFLQPRTLTVREWARLQEFPDWYQFMGKRTTGGIRRAGNPIAGNFDRELPKYTQIGNAVPVRLAESLGKHFLKILNKK